MCSQESIPPVNEAESHSAALDAVAKSDEQRSESRTPGEEKASLEGVVPLNEANPTHEEEKTVEEDSPVITDMPMKEESVKDPVDVSSNDQPVSNVSSAMPVESNAAVEHPVEERMEEPENPSAVPVPTHHASQPKRSAHLDDNSDDEYTSDYLEVSSKRRRRETRSCICAFLSSHVAALQESMVTPILKGQYFIHDTICTWEGKVAAEAA